MTLSKHAFSTAVHIVARRVGLALALALVVPGTACRTQADAKKGPGVAAQSDSAATPFRVALLTPGPISDQSWNGGAYQGLLRVRDSLGATVSHIQTKTPAEFDEQFRQYGSQGYDLVFGHGFEFQDAAKRVGPDYPRTIYIVTSGSSVAANVAGIEFGFADASYLAGMLAGSMTKTNMIGVIGGTELPPVKESFSAFTLGAKSVNPKVAVLTSYIGNWDDVSAGREQALAQIGRNADVIFQNADAAGLGVFRAARETKRALVIGSNSNQNAVAPEITIASVVIDLPHAFLTVAREVRSGTFKPRVIKLGTESDVVTLVINPSFRSRIPALAMHAVDSVRVELTAHRFDPLGVRR
jgi:basic membrane protein A